MKITIHGEWTLAQIRQCIFEQLLDLEERKGIHSARGVNLYLTLTEENGRKATVTNAIGGEVRTIDVLDISKFPTDEPPT
jgi:hypothetical protein